MRLSQYTRILIGCLLVATGFAASAQESAPAGSGEEQQVVAQGKRYIEINLHALDKCSKRIQRQQERLVHKLQKKEHRLMRKLRRSDNATDSAAYVRLQSQQVNYDSIGKLLHADSATVLSKIGRRKNAVFDSLKGVQTFIQTNATKANLNSPALSSYSSEIAQLQQKTDYQNYINELITRHTNSLKNLTGNTGNIPGLSGIEKEVFYGKAKMNTWKQVAEDPSKAEEKALEYLQGTPGFDQQLSQSTNPNSGMNGSMSADALEQMGYQTKSQLNKSLQQKFGGNLSQVQQQVSAQISDWQNKVTDAKNTATHLKSNISNLKSPFNKNPMRGLPFWKRIEKSYNWQTTRATTDGTPAMLQLAGMAGYKQTPKLTYGIGIAADFGLGQDWNHIHLSFEGVGLRSFAKYDFIYGIGLYAGYERTYKRAVFNNSSAAPTELSNITSPHSTQYYNESALIGLAKSYKLNSKWNGAVQVLYDIWWREKGLRSPIVLRVETTSKK
ncbi:hypothetical protein ACTHGU_04800 [Chitinophagaceae bacterium MMS25-I14]